MVWTNDARWMYGIERYLYALKGFVRHRARLEVAIAQRYMSHETQGFVSEYLPHMQPPLKRMWSLEEDLENNSEVVMGQGCVRVVEEPKLMKLHLLVQAQFIGFLKWLAKWIDERLHNKLGVEVEVALLAQHPSGRVIE